MQAMLCPCAELGLVPSPPVFGERGKWEPAVRKEASDRPMVAPVFPSERVLTENGKGKARGRGKSEEGSEGPWVEGRHREGGGEGKT